MLISDLSRVPDPRAPLADRLLRAMRNRNAGIMEDVLPHPEQITRAIGQGATWNDALRTVGFEPYEQPVRRTALTVQEAFDVIADTCDVLASPHDIDQLRKRFGVSIEVFPRGADWQRTAAALVADRQKRGLPVPTRRLRYGERAALLIPDAVLAELPRAQPRERWTRDTCLAALAQYLRTAAKPSQRDYQTRFGVNGWPAVRTIQRFGSWAAMLDAARELLRTGEIVPATSDDRRT